MTPSEFTSLTLSKGKRIKAFLDGYYYKKDGNTFLFGHYAYLPQGWTPCLTIEAECRGLLDTRQSGHMIKLCIIRPFQTEKLAYIPFSQINAIKEVESILEPIA